MIFDRNRVLSRKRDEISPWLVQITDMKSFVSDRSASVPMIMSFLERRDTRSPIFPADFRMYARACRLTQNDRILHDTTRGGEACLCGISHATRPKGRAPAFPNFWTLPTRIWFDSELFVGLFSSTQPNPTHQTRIWHVPAKHANGMDARAHSSTLTECAPRFMTRGTHDFVCQSSPNLAHV